MSHSPDQDTIPPAVDCPPVLRSSHFSANPSDWGEDISPDGTDKLLYKKIIKEGKEENTPLKGDRVFVNYEGRLLDGSIFDHSKDASAPFEVDIGIGEVIKGWDICLLTMKSGEICLLTCLPEMAYGGDAFGKTIPPDSTLQFELELVTWHGMYCTNSGGLPQSNVLKSCIREAGPNHKRFKMKNGSEIKINIAGTTDDCRTKEFYNKKCLSLNVDEVVTYALPDGLRYGLLKMKPGEIARINIPPTFGYNKSSLDEYGIPLNSILVFEVELLSAENNLEYWEYNTNEERVDAAEHFKSRGTELFKQDYYDLAQSSYKKGFEIVKLENLSNEDALQTKQIRLALELNISACEMKLNENMSAIKTCTNVINEDPTCIKAYFRRGMANFEIKEFESACKDFKKVLELDPDNKAAVKFLEKAGQMRKKQIEGEKKLYSGMFGLSTNASSDASDNTIIEMDPSGTHSATDFLTEPQSTTTSNQVDSSNDANIDSIDS